MFFSDIRKLNMKLSIKYFKYRTSGPFLKQINMQWIWSKIIGIFFVFSYFKKNCKKNTTYSNQIFHTVKIHSKNCFRSHFLSTARIRSSRRWQGKWVMTDDSRCAFEAIVFAVWFQDQDQSDLVLDRRRSTSFAHRLWLLKHIKTEFGSSPGKYKSLIIKCLNH